MKNNKVWGKVPLNRFLALQGQREKLDSITKAWNDFVFLAGLLVPPDQVFHEDEIGLLCQFMNED